MSDAKFLKKLEACGITDLVNAFATFKNEKELKKTDGAKRSRITGETCSLLMRRFHLRFTLFTPESCGIQAYSCLHWIREGPCTLFIALQAFGSF